MATFNIDCDGVLRNLLVGMCEVYNHEFDVFMQPEDVDKYDVDEVFVLCKEYLNMSAAEFLFDKYGSFCFRHSPMIDKAKEAIDMLHNAGHKICIVTYQKTYDCKEESRVDKMSTRQNVLCKLLFAIHCIDCLYHLSLKPSLWSLLILKSFLNILLKMLQ